MEEDGRCGVGESVRGGCGREVVVRGNVRA
jgi:hypothetical protein